MAFCRILIGGLSLALGFAPGVAVADVTHAGPARTSCVEIAAVNASSAQAQSALSWAAGYWTAFNLLLADQCFDVRDLTDLAPLDQRVWNDLAGFCTRFPNHDLQAAAFAVLMQQPVSSVLPKPQCTD